MSEIICHKKDCEFYDHEYGLCGFQTIEVDEKGRCIYRNMSAEEFNKIQEAAWEKLSEDLRRIAKESGKCA